MPSAYALIDCTNFYASCERVFDPALNNRPVAILSNNDGCVIARSERRPKMQVEMGEPEFKQQDIFRRHSVASVLSVALRTSKYADPTDRYKHGLNYHLQLPSAHTPYLINVPFTA